MNKSKYNILRYEIQNSHAYGTYAKCTHSLDTAVEIHPKINGYMLIGPYTFDIQSGICRPDMRLLDNSEHTVSIHDGRSVITADKIKKDGRIISFAPFGESEARALRGEVIHLQREIADLKRSLAQIREKIDGVSIL